MTCRCALLGSNPGALTMETKIKISAGEVIVVSAQDLVGGGGVVPVGTFDNVMLLKAAQEAWKKGWKLVYTRVRLNSFQPPMPNQCY